MYRGSIRGAVYKIVQTLSIISYSFLLINCINYFRYNPEAVFSLPGAIKATARSLGFCALAIYPSQSFLKNHPHL